MYICIYIYIHIYIYTCIHHDQLMDDPSIECGTMGPHTIPRKGAHHLPPTGDDDEAKCRSLPGGGAGVSKLRVASNG